MPTAAKLTALIVFAILGYFIFAVMVPLFDEAVVPRFLLPVCVGVGAWSGWVFCGAKTMDIRSGIGTGMTAMAAMVFGILFIMSFVQMIHLSLRRRYDGPMEAIVDVFNLMYDNLLIFGTQTMGLTLLVGGLIAGLVTGIIGKKYPR